MKAEIKVDKDIDRASTSARKAQTSFGGLRRSIADTNRSFTFLRNIMGLLKWPALITGVGLAASAIAALGAGLVGLLGSLEPLIGLIGVLPIGLAAAAGAMLTIKLAFRDLGKAIGGNVDAFKGLTAEGKEFAKFIRGLKPILTDLQRTAQKGLFPGLEKGIRLAITQENLAVIKRAITNFSRDLGRIFENLGRQIGRVSFSIDLERLFEAGDRLVVRFGKSLGNLVNIFRSVGVAAIPLSDRLGVLLNRMTKWLDLRLEAARDSGGLQRFFKTTGDEVVRLSGFLTAAARALHALLAPSRGLGDTILDDLTRKFNEWAKWANSFKGRTALEDYFQRVKPLLYETARLIGAVVGQLARLAGDPRINKDLERLIRQIRVEMLPAFVEMVRVTTKELAPALIDAVTGIVRIISQLSGATGPLQAFIGIIAKLANGLADLGEQHSTLATMTIALLSLSGIIRALKFVTFITGLQGIAKYGAKAATALEGLAGAEVAVAAGSAGGAAKLKKTEVAAGAAATKTNLLAKAVKTLGGAFGVGLAAGGFFGGAANALRLIGARALTLLTRLTRLAKNPWVIAVTLTVSAIINKESRKQIADFLGNFGTVKLPGGKTVHLFGSTFEDQRKQDKADQAAANRAALGRHDDKTGLPRTTAPQVQRAGPNLIRDLREELAALDRIADKAAPAVARKLHAQAARIRKLLRGTVTVADVREAKQLLKELEGTEKQLGLGKAPTKDKAKVPLADKSAVAELRRQLAVIDRLLARAGSGVAARLRPRVAEIRKLLTGVVTAKEASRAGQLISGMLENVGRAVDRFSATTNLKAKLGDFRKQILKGLDPGDRRVALKKLNELRAHVARVLKDGIVGPSELAALRRHEQNFKAALSRLFSAEGIEHKAQSTLKQLKQLFKAGFIDSVDYREMSAGLQRVLKLKQKFLKDGSISKAEAAKLRKAYEDAASGVSAGVKAMLEAIKGVLKIKDVGIPKVLSDLRKQLAGGLIDASTFRGMEAQAKGLQQLVRELAKGGFTKEEIDTINDAFDRWKDVIGQVPGVLAKLNDALKAGFIDPATFDRFKRQLLELLALWQRLAKGGWTPAEIAEWNRAWDGFTSGLDEAIDKGEDALAAFRELDRDFEKFWSDGLFDDEELSTLRSLGGRLGETLGAALDKALDAVDQAKAKFEKTWDRFRSNIIRLFEEGVVGKVRLDIEFGESVLEGERAKQAITSSIGVISAELKKGLDASAKHAMLLINRHRAAMREYQNALISGNRERIRGAAAALASIEQEIEDFEASTISDQARIILGAGKTIVEAERTLGDQRVEEHRKTWEELKSVELEELGDLLDRLRDDILTHKKSWPEALAELTGWLNSHGVDIEQAGALLGGAFQTGLNDSLANVATAIGGLNDTMRDLAALLRQLLGPTRNQTAATNANASAADRAAAKNNKWADALRRVSGWIDRIDATKLQQIAGTTGINNPNAPINTGVIPGALNPPSSGSGSSGGFTRFPSGPVPMARGGVVPGAGTGDTVAAMLTPGEVVLNKRQQALLGQLAGSHGHAGGLLRRVLAGSRPSFGRGGFHFADGGFVPNTVDADTISDSALIRRFMPLARRAWRSFIARPQFRHLKGVGGRRRFPWFNFHPGWGATGAKNGIWPSGHGRPRSGTVDFGLDYARLMFGVTPETWPAGMRVPPAVRGAGVNVLAHEFTHVMQRDDLLRLYGSSFRNTALIESGAEAFAELTGPKLASALRVPPLRKQGGSGDSGNPYDWRIQLFPKPGWRYILRDQFALLTQPVERPGAAGQSTVGQSTSAPVSLTPVAATKGLAGGGPVAFRTGGLVPHGMGREDSVHALLSPGELILNRAQQQRVAEQLHDGDTYITVPVYGSVIRERDLALSIRDILAREGARRVGGSYAGRADRGR